MNKKIFNNHAFEILELFLPKQDARLHGRQIAKRLKANQRTASLYLDALAKDRILLSETKGRNKEFFLNKENELTKQLIIITELRKAMKLIERNFEIYSIVKDLRAKTKGMIIIYGSYAKGYEKEGSDIDILITGNVPKKYAKDIKRRYPTKIHMMRVTEEEFIEGLKEEKPFMKEITTGHIIVQGVEEFTRIMWEYG